MFITFSERVMKLIETFMTSHAHRRRCLHKCHFYYHHYHVINIFIISLSFCHHHYHYNYYQYYQYRFCVIIIITIIIIIIIIIMIIITAAFIIIIIIISIIIHHCHHHWCIKRTNTATIRLSMFPKLTEIGLSTTSYFWCMAYKAHYIVVVFKNIMLQNNEIVQLKSICKHNNGIWRHIHTLISWNVAFGMRIHLRYCAVRAIYHVIRKRDFILTHVRV